MFSAVVSLILTIFVKICSIRLTQFVFIAPLCFRLVNAVTKVAKKCKYITMPPFGAHLPIMGLLKSHCNNK